MGSKKVQVACIFAWIVFVITRVESAEFNVKTYGVKGDGQSDDSQAILKAWADACKATDPSKLIVPAGKYMVGPMKILGPCGNPVTFEADGATFIAPTDLSLFKGQDGWILFYGIEGLTISGLTLEGKGEIGWKTNNCKKSFSGNCKFLPINLNLGGLTNALVKGVTSIDSKFFHMNVIQGKNVTLSDITITAPGDSENTDGIHIGRSTGVSILGATIKTGDDCVSLGDGSKQVSIENVKCGPGHGISIGSLGKYKDEQPVEGVTVKHCTLTGTTNGVRIKTWPASPEGIASGMHFEDVTMENVSNPILIDQEYCPWNQCTAGVPSKVKISDVSFKNIKGTSATKVAVKLACSKGVPCEKVEVGDINLEYHGTNGTAISECSNVKPTLSGKQSPAVCDGAAGGGAAAPAGTASA
ncbi:unnamed protein product [Cuscuta campestris]|uniref:Uncharacterized protein n=1 Tax=Cuscuta campestris TaxID=132261 RepID=A0A484N100_9ASTE|nr:unnamed protein product [Cuscuta campestris]